MESEEILIQNIQDWAYEKFEKLYDLYFPKVYRFILLKTDGNIALTEDICSETFCKAFENLSNQSFKAQNFQSCIYTIAYHSFIDFIKRPNLDSLDDNTENSWENIVDFLDKKEKVKSIITYLDSLWEDKKDLFLLRVQESLRYEEIAVILGKTTESCRKEFSRILKKVSEKYHYFA